LPHHLGMGRAHLRMQVGIEQAAETWLSQYSSANTRAAYSSDLRSFLSWFGDDSSAMAATADEMGRFREERESSGISTATVDRQFAALRAFYATACELGACLENPFGTPTQTVTTTSVTGSLAGDEIGRLEAAAAVDPRTSVLVHLLAGEGMRLAEILALDHADVSGTKNAKRLRVTRHDGRVDVALDRDSSRALGELEPTTPDPGPLFVGPSRGRGGATRLTRFGADHLLKLAAVAAGITQSVSANVLRRTHVTNAQRDGVPIADIRDRMGHRDVRTTRRYLAPPDDDPTNKPEGS
jgi:site-specific recombinase XerD